MRWWLSHQVSLSVICVVYCVILKLSQLEERFSNPIEPWTALFHFSDNSTQSSIIQRWRCAMQDDWQWFVTVTSSSDQCLTWHVLERLTDDPTTTTAAAAAEGLTKILSHSTPSYYRCPFSVSVKGMTSRGRHAVKEQTEHSSMIKRTDSSNAVQHSWCFDLITSDSVA